MSTELDDLELYYLTLPPERKAFLDKYADIGVINETCRLLGVTDRTVRRWKEEKPFQQLFALAEEVFTQKLELELYKRALNKDVSKMSDVLLMFTLKAKRPDVYREKTIAPTIVGDIIIKMAIPPYNDKLLNKENIIEGEFVESSGSSSSKSLSVP